jgi:hypothetical protein
MFCKFENTPSFKSLISLITLLKFESNYCLFSFSLYKFEKSKELLTSFTDLLCFTFVIGLLSNFDNFRL